MKLKRFINWKSYFSEEQVNKYNLKNTNIIKLYNTNDFNIYPTYCCLPPDIFFLQKASYLPALPIRLP